LVEHVKTQTRAAAFVGGQQAAEHADGGGFAAAVGAQKTVNLAFFHAQAQAIDDALVAERFAQALHVNGVLAAHCLLVSSETLTG
jgi:hypothetical protein